MKHLFIALFALFASICKLPAQTSAMHMHHASGQSSKNIFLMMMDTMMIQMDHASRGNSPEADFLSEMIPHHQGAVNMATYEIRHGHDFEMIQLAKSILAEQQSEMAEMRMWLGGGSGDGGDKRDMEGRVVRKDSVERDGGTEGKEREAMDQTMMVMMTNLPASESLKDVDHAFASVMLPHHQAAIDMARVVLYYGKDPQTVAFAKLLIANEQIEIQQMRASLSAPARNDHTHDRVYTANQVSNTISVVNPSNNTFVGEIVLGKPYPGVLTPLYKGESLVHGLGYSPAKKLLAAVGIGSNSVSVISTETNQVLKTIYVGRSPHESTFTPDGKQIWTSVRGEAYISVIDVASLEEIKHVPVADGPGMVSFTPDGKLAYVCSSFTPELDIVNTTTYQVVKRIPVVSPFSPNIFTSPHGEWIAMTHKDIGKVTVIDTRTQTVAKVLPTGPITNHVTFCYLNGKLLMLVTVGGENKVRVYEPELGFKQTDSIAVGALPHGIWSSADGELAYAGLEFGDQVQGIDLTTMQALPPVQIGQSPQALVYAHNAVTDPNNAAHLRSLQDSGSTSVLTLKSTSPTSIARGRLSVRPEGLVDLVEQLFTNLDPHSAYTLCLSHSKEAPYTPDYTINVFTTDETGRYAGQSTGTVRNTQASVAEAYRHIVLINNLTKEAVLLDE